MQVACPTLSLRYAPPQLALGLPPLRSRPRGGSVLGSQCRAIENNGEQLWCHFQFCHAQCSTHCDPNTLVQYLGRAKYLRDLNND